jgi:hypothetical protein
MSAYNDNFEASTSYANDFEESALMNDKDFNNSEYYFEDSFENYETVDGGMFVCGQPIDNLIQLEEMGSNPINKDGSCKNDNDNIFPDYNDDYFDDEFGSYVMTSIEEEEPNNHEDDSHHDNSSPPKIKINNSSNNNSQIYPVASIISASLKSNSIYTKKPVLIKSSKSKKYERKVMRVTYNDDNGGNISPKILPSVPKAKSLQVGTTIDNTVTKQTLKIQLEIAYKKITQYRKDIADLHLRLDSSTNEAEIFKLRNHIKKQNSMIENLSKGKKGLESVARYQSKQLTENNKQSGKDNCDIESIEDPKNQVKILLERVRRLNDKLSIFRSKEMTLINSNKDLTNKNSKLKEKLVQTLNEKKLREAASLQILSKLNNNNNNQEIVEEEVEGQEVEKNNHNGYNCEEGSLVEQSSVLQGEPSIATSILTGDPSLKQSEKIYKKFTNSKHNSLISGSLVTATTMHTSTPRTIENYEQLVIKLKRSLKIQRSGFLTELASVRGEMENYKTESKRLEEELLKRDKQVRTQV